MFASCPPAEVGAGGEHGTCACVTVTWHDMALLAKRTAAADIEALVYVVAIGGSAWMVLVLSFLQVRMRGPRVKELGGAKGRQGSGGGRGRRAGARGQGRALYGGTRRPIRTSASSASQVFYPLLASPSLHACVLVRALGVLLSSRMAGDELRPSVFGASW